MTEKLGFFPAFLKTEGKRVLVIGAGTIATRRTLALVDFSWQVDVIAPEASAQILQLCKQGEINYYSRSAVTEDPDSYDLVLACTDSREVNQAIVTRCRSLSIPVNDCSSHEDCDFYFPGLVIRDSVVIGVTASGSNHKKAKQIRECIAEILEEEGKFHES